MTVNRQCKKFSKNQCKKYKNSFFTPGPEPLATPRTYHQIRALARSFLTIHYTVVSDCNMRINSFDKSVEAIVSCVLLKHTTGTNHFKR